MTNKEVGHLFFVVVFVILFVILLCLLYYEFLFHCPAKEVMFHPAFVIELSTGRTMCPIASTF